MCFALPLKVISLKDHQAKMEDGRLVKLPLIGKVKKNDWLLVKSDLALEKLSAKEAKLMRRSISEVTQ